METSIRALGRRPSGPPGAGHGKLAAVALAVLFSGTATLAAPQAVGQEFRRLNAAEIRGRVVGRDITDDAHWAEYYRSDGVLIIDDLGARRSGRWSVERDMLCTTNARAAPHRCWQVWLSGSEISLRERPQDSPPPAYLRQHRGR